MPLFFSKILEKNFIWRKSTQKIMGKSRDMEQLLQNKNFLEFIGHQ